MSLDEIRAEVCWRLKRRNCWGARYMPVDTLVYWLGKLVKDDGKRVHVAIDELVKEGLLLGPKKRRTVSLNPHRVHEIEALLEKHL
ncbi:hypothetical protein KJ885_06415 [Patescibacteria group bacterium]|nr:hypothetical protein [Patescibacteria group bacterium]